MKKRLGVLALMLASITMFVAPATVSAQSWDSRGGYGYAPGWNNRYDSGQYRNFDRDRRDRRDFERQQRFWRERQRWERRQWNNSRRFRDNYYSPRGYNPYRGY